MTRLKICRVLGGTLMTDDDRGSRRRGEGGGGKIGAPSVVVAF